MGERQTSLAEFCFQSRVYFTCFFLHVDCWSLRLHFILFQFTFTVSSKVFISPVFFLHVYCWSLRIHLIIFQITFMGWSHVCISLVFFCSHVDCWNLRIHFSCLRNIELCIFIEMSTSVGQDLKSNDFKSRFQINILLCAILILI